MLRSVGFNPGHKTAQAAVDRLQAFQQAAASHTMRHLRAMIVNDGAAYVRELSPRSRSVTFDFIQRVFEVLKHINLLDEGAGYPGARMVVAVGPRLRMPGSTRFNEEHLKSLLNRVKTKTISVQQAMLEAFHSSPLAGSAVPLQANFAFTKAYLADQAGRKAGLAGPKFFIERTFFKEIPLWLSHRKSIDWSTEGLSASFLEVESIDGAKAGKEQYRELRDAEEIAVAMGIDYPAKIKMSYRARAAAVKKTSRSRR